MFVWIVFRYSIYILMFLNAFIFVVKICFMLLWFCFVSVLLRIILFVCKIFCKGVCIFVDLRILIMFLWLERLYLRIMSAFLLSISSNDIFWWLIWFSKLVNEEFLWESSYLVMWKLMLLRFLVMSMVYDVWFLFVDDFMLTRERRCSYIIWVLILILYVVFGVYDFVCVL